MFAARAAGRLIAIQVWLLLAAGPIAAETSAAGTDASAVEAGKPSKAWDQPAVTALAQELAGDVKGVRAAFRSQPPAHIGGGEARARTRLLDLLRLIESESRYLANQLAAGEGRDTTTPVFERLLEMIRKAQDYRARIFVQSTALDAIEKARQPLTALSAYYGSAVPTQRNVVR